MRASPAMVEPAILLIWQLFAVALLLSTINKSYNILKNGPVKLPLQAGDLVFQ